MLPRNLKQLASREARSRGISLGELIREALTQLLRSGREAAAEDPLLADTAVYEGPTPTDTSRAHDDLLYGPTKRK